MELRAAPCAAAGIDEGPSSSGIGTLTGGAPPSGCALLWLSSGYAELSSPSSSSRELSSINFDAAIGVDQNDEYRIAMRRASLKGTQRQIEWKLRGGALRDGTETKGVAAPQRVNHRCIYTFPHSLGSSCSCIRGLRGLISARTIRGANHLARLREATGISLLGQFKADNAEIDRVSHQSKGERLWWRRVGRVGDCIEHPHSGMASTVLGILFPISGPVVRSLRKSRVPVS